MRVDADGGIYNRPDLFDDLKDLGSYGSSVSVAQDDPLGAGVPGSLKRL